MLVFAGLPLLLVRIFFPLLLLFPRHPKKMRIPLLFLPFTALLLTLLLQSPSHAAAPTGPLIKHLSSILKLTKSASKSTQSDGNAVQFENGYLVETVVEGNALGVVPYSIRVSQDGELFAADSDNSNIVRIMPPLSQYSRARLVAGSFQGKTGHVDGKPSDARFDHPKGVAVDDKGNVYVADTVNLAIRKIGEAGVTTIAGGKSSIPGYSDGPSEDAKFSTDFDVVYIRHTCSLLVVDRGNAALRQISLNQDDCDYQSSSVSGSDICMVIGAILVGYATCIVQQGFGPLFPKMAQPSAVHVRELNKIKPTPVIERVKEEPIAGWPSFGQLIVDLSKLVLEGMGSTILYLIPSRLRHGGSGRNGLTSVKDSLRMPEDGTMEPQSAKKHKAPATASANPGDEYPEMKTESIGPTSLKDASLSSKHRSKRQEYGQFYGSTEIPGYSNQVKPKSQKDRTKHRHREKSGEVAAPVGSEPKPVEIKAGNNDVPRFDPYHFQAKYATDDLYRY
ncbi:hypothetical protein Dimus_012726 [Dionaea muscipula]